MNIIAAQRISSYSLPNWLGDANWIVDPIGEPYDPDGLKGINESVVTILETVWSCAPYTHIINASSNKLDYLFLVQFDPYTSDSNDVISVVWYVASESVADHDDDDGEPIDGPLDEDRMRFTIDHIYASVVREFPNATDIWIGDGGFENQFAPMSPRSETTTGAIYEPFFDDMTRIEDNAITAALRKYPTPDPEPTPNEAGSYENPYQSDPWETRRTTTQHLYVHRFIGTGRETYYHAYRDGWSQGSDRNTYELAAADLFSPYGWPGGYELTYYPYNSPDDSRPDDISGITLCAECACKNWLEDPTSRFHVESSDGDGKYECPTYCDGCNTVIVEQACPHCGDPINEPTGYPHNPLIPALPNLAHDYLVIHARCMADLVAHCQAQKTGKGEYTIPFNSHCWATGVYRTPVHDSEKG